VIHFFFYLSLCTLFILRQMPFHSLSIVLFRFSSHDSTTQVAVAWTIRSPSPCSTLPFPQPSPNALPPSCVA
jgi:hypothetical protein